MATTTAPQPTRSAVTYTKDDGAAQRVIGHLFALFYRELKAAGVTVEVLHCKGGLKHQLGVFEEIIRRNKEHAIDAQSVAAAWASLKQIDIDWDAAETMQPAVETEDQGPG